MHYRAYIDEHWVGTIELDHDVESPPNVIEDQYGRTWKLVKVVGDDFFGVDELRYVLTRKVSAQFHSLLKMTRTRIRRNERF